MSLNWERIQNRTSNVIKGKPVINWAGSHYHHLGEFLLPLQSRPTFLFLLLHSPSEFFLARGISGIIGSIRKSLLGCFVYFIESIPYIINSVNLFSSGLFLWKLSQKLMVWLNLLFGLSPSFIYGHSAFARPKRTLCLQRILQNCSFVTSFFRNFGRNCRISLYKGDAENWEILGLRFGDGSLFNVLL